MRMLGRTYSGVQGFVRCECCRDHTPAGRTAERRLMRRRENQQWLAREMASTY